MRIGVDIRSLVGGRTSGVEVYTRKLLEHLIKLDQDNKYLLFYNSYKARTPQIDLPETGNYEIKSFSYPNRLLNFTMKFFAWPKIDKLLGGIDLFFSPRYLFSAVSRSCPVVVTAHDISYVHNPDFFSGKQRLWHWIVNDKKVFEQAALILSVSDYTKQDLVKHFSLPERKIVTVNPGIDHSFYFAENQDSDTQVLGKYCWEKDYLIYLGTLEPRKNIDGIVAAYELFRETYAKKVQLVIAGNMGWLYEHTLMRIRKSKFASDIKVLGQIREEEKPALYRGSKTLLFPSYYEGFGFPPLEAMACSRPAVVSYHSSFQEILGEAGLYINPFRPGQIARVIKDLYDDKDWYEAKKSLSKKVSEKYSWDKTARETLNAFKMITS